MTGLIDFGAMGIDSVVADLVRLFSEWSPNEPDLRFAALNSYESLRPLTPDETSPLEVFKLSLDFFSVATGRLAFPRSSTVHRSRRDSSRPVEGVEWVEKLGS